MTPARLRQTSVLLLLIPAALAACAGPSRPPAAITYDGPRFTGEVLGWDAAQGLVTLRTVDGDIRVRVHPDQIGELRRHAVVTLPGELVLPAEVTILPGQSTFTPTGSEDQSHLKARIVAVDILGRITVESERGPTDVWVDDATHYSFGDPVLIRISVRTGRVKKAPGEAVPTKTPPLTLRTTEPGQHAIVVGRILSVDPRGTLTVESPRGPIRVWATLNLGRYLIGDFVEVRTRVLGK